MGILAGPLAVTPYRILDAPAVPDFELAPFHAIPPGSELRSSLGFLPAAGERAGDQGGYLAFPNRFFFRVRKDTLAPDPVLVKERTAELIATEREQSPDGFVSAKKRRRFKALAEEELLAAASPRARITEGYLDVARGIAYVFSAADGVLGEVEALLRRLDVVLERQYPWPRPIDEGVAYDEHPGAAFLEALIGDGQFPFEPVHGWAQLRRGDELRHAVAGEVMSEIVRAVDAGDILVAAKLCHEQDIVFKLDAERWRLSGVRLESATLPTWRERLDQRIGWLEGLLDALGERYRELSGPKEVKGREAAAKESGTTITVSVVGGSTTGPIPVEKFDRAARKIIGGGR